MDIDEMMKGWREGLISNSEVVAELAMRHRCKYLAELAEFMAGKEDDAISALMALEFGTGATRH